MILKSESAQNKLSLLSSSDNLVIVNDEDNRKDRDELLIIPVADIQVDMDAPKILKKKR